MHRPAVPPSFLHLARHVLLLALPGLAMAQAAPGASTVPDTIAQRVVACAACHGKEGRSTNQGYFPRIAGKPAGYLYNQLVNFRDGRRDYAVMTYLVEHLSDAYLLEMAQYYAGLDLPYPPPEPATAPKAQLEHGRVLVTQGDAARRIPACVQCHGQALTGMLPATPGLLGLSRDYLNAQLGAWKLGHRRATAPDCMAEITAPLTPDDISALSAWLSSQTVPAPAHPAPAPTAKLPLACGSALK